jgi:sulfur-oxidizing protein SoxY
VYEPAITRREGLALALLVLPATSAQATPEAMQAAVAAFTGGRPWKEERVALDIPPLVENGNAVPVRVEVEGAGSEIDRVRAIALFTERNPLPEAGLFLLGAGSPRAEVATRIRLATSQRVLALARLADGRCVGRQVEVVVTLAACVEG